MNTLRQIKCWRIIHIAYRGAIIGRPERDLGVGLAGAIYRHRSADKIDIRDVWNNQGAEIIYGGTCYHELCWEDEGRAMCLGTLSTGH